MVISMNDKKKAYYQGLNKTLLDAVHQDAKTILDVGCGEGRMGEALKVQNPDRMVYGIEKEPEIAKMAAARLDRVFTMDLEKDTPEIPKGSLDLIIYGDVLEHLYDPVSVLQKHRQFLKPPGRVLCSVPNIQHHSIIRQLFRSDWQYQKEGLLDFTHLRFFTYSTFTKTLLDAGFAPKILNAVSSPADDSFYASMESFFAYLGLHPGRTRNYMNIYQYIFEGVPLYEEEDMEQDKETPVSFVVCMSNPEVFHNNLNASPCLGKGTPHELIVVQKAPSAADGFHLGLEKAKNEYMVLVHQDMYFPKNWPKRFVKQFRLAESRFGKVGVAGVCGATRDNGRTRIHASVVDRHRLLMQGALPAKVETLDEVVIGVRKDTSLRMDPGLGFHLYAADLCLLAKQNNEAAVAIDNLCFHNSLLGEIPKGFHDSASFFRNKWKDFLPVATPNAMLS